MLLMKKVILTGRSKENAAQELVEEGANGYTFNLEDSEEVVEKINRILSDVKFRESMQEEFYRMIQVHRIEKSVSSLEKIYESLLA